MKTLKRIIFLLALAIPALPAAAQKMESGQVPQKVRNVMEKAYPNAQDVEWEKSGNLYVVEFEIGTPDLDHKMWITEAGKLERHKEEMNPQSLPASIREAIKKEYPGYVVDDVTRNMENGTVTYKAELESGVEELEVIFSESGKILSSKPD